MISSKEKIFYDLYLDKYICARSWADILCVEENISALKSKSVSAEDLQQNPSCILQRDQWVFFELGFPLFHPGLIGEACRALKLEPTEIAAIARYERIYKDGQYIAALDCYQRQSMENEE